jgi:hypothetical protein
MAGSLTMVYDIIARDRASAVFARTGASAETAGARIGALGKALGVFAAIDIGAHAVKMAADFQKSTNVFVTAAGETTANLKTVRAGILNIATGTGAPIKGLTDAMYLIEKAGIRGADGLKVLRASAQGAAEENANLATVTQAVTSIMQSYHLNANDSVNITNELKAAAGESKVTMEQFAGSLSTVLPVASANHIAFADVAGALATLTQHGTSADEATQELSNTIRNLSAPNQVASKEMAQLGIRSTEVSQSLGSRGLTGTLEYLSETVLRKMGPSGLVLLNTFNQSKVAAEDAQREFGALGPEAQKLAKSFEDGSIGIGAYRKAAKGLGGEQGALALQFLTTYTNAHGFQQAIKNGVPGAQTYTDAIKKMTGGANGLNTTLQITGENLFGTEERTKRVADAFKLGGKDVQGWASTQALFSTKMAEFRNQISVLGIKIGTGLLPVVGGVVTALGNGLGVVSRNSALFGTLAKVIGGAAVAYYSAALAVKVYEAASVRVTSVIRGLTSAYVLARAATIADYTAVGVSAIRYAGYAVAVAAAVSAIHNLTNTGKTARNIVADLTRGFDASRPESYGETIDKLQGKVRSLGSWGSSVRSVFNTMLGGLTGHTVADDIATVGALNNKIADLQTRSIRAKEATFELGKRFNLTDPEVRALAKSFGVDLGGATQDVVNRISAMNGQISDFINLKTGTKIALLDFEDGLRTLRSDLDKNTHDWSDNTAAGSRNQRVVASLVQSLGRYHDNLVQTQGDTPATAAAVGKLRSHFADLLGQITGNRQQADQLLDAFGALPADKTIGFHVPGLAEANVLAGNLANTIRNLPTRKDIDIAIHQQTSGPAGQFAPYLGLGTGSGFAFGPGHADGGFITGPGGPRDDRIFSMLSNGEFVVNAASTSRFRPLLEAINGKARATAARFAAGGPVVTGKTQTVADFKLDAVKPDNKVFDDLFKAPPWRRRSTNRRSTRRPRQHSSTRRPSRSTSRARPRSCSAIRCRPTSRTGSPATDPTSAGRTRTRSPTRGPAPRSG